jgi:hypothetical protein
MIEEIPYGKYIEKINNSSELSYSNISIESLPVSIEIIPHTAIIVNEVYAVEVRRQSRECPNYIKWLIVSSFCIPLVIIISSLRMNT